METQQTTALNDMSKQIEELRSLQTQQTEEIRKDLGGEINSLKDIIEKYFSNAPSSFSQREGKQREDQTSFVLTATETEQRPVPPDRFSLGQSATKDQRNHDHHQNQTRVSLMDCHHD